MMITNDLYAATDRMVAEKAKVDKKLGLAETKLTTIFAEQATAIAKLNEAQKVERTVLTTEQAVRFIKLFAE